MKKVILILIIFILLTTSTILFIKYRSSKKEKLLECLNNAEEYFDFEIENNCNIGSTISDQIINGTYDQCVISKNNIKIIQEHYFNRTKKCIND